MVNVFSVPFPYLDQSHVFVTVNGVPTAYTFSTSATIQVLPAPTGIVQIRRITPKDNPPVNFSDGSVLREQELDLLATFTLYCAQEAQDVAEAAIGPNGSNVWDGRGLPTTNFAAPTTPTSLVTKQFLDDTYVTGILGSAATATSAASSAQGYAALANGSSDQAAALLALFRGQYFGALASDPTLDANGSPVTPGDLYFNTVMQKMRVRGTSTWIDAGSSIQSYLNKSNTPIVATGGQTTFPVPGGYDPNFILVFLNGSQVVSPDVTTTSGTNIVFASGLTAGDEVTYVAFGSFNVANAIPASGSVVDLSVSTTSKLYNRIEDHVSVKDHGAKGDGTTDDTAAIAACIAYCALKGRTVYFPSGTYITSTITVPANTSLLGENPYATTIKLKNGTNASLIQSTQAQTLGLGGSNNIGDVGISIQKLTLDGNSANNTSSTDKDGCGVFIFGERMVLRELYVRNTAGHGLLTDGPQYGSPAGDYFGMEGHFERIVVDTVGKHGWYFNGPHDSTSHHILVIDAGQKTDNTYSSLYLNTPSRFFSYHGWTRSVANRHKYACNIQPSGGGSQFIASQFEGSVTANLNMNASNCAFDNTCAYYAAFGGVNIFLGGTSTGNDIRGNVAGSPVGNPDPIGVAISNAGGDFVRGNNVDLVMAQQLNSNVFFGAGDKGNNTIRVNAYQTSGSRYSGTPHSSDVVEINVYGNTSFNYAPLRPVAYATFDGTVATPTIASSYNVSSVTKTGTGAYTINFANNIPSSASMVATAESTKVVGRPYGNSPGSQDVRCAVSNTAAATDSAIITVMFYAN